MNAHQIENDTVDALVALGHRKAEAKRMVGDALASGVQPTSVQDLLQAVYQRPSSVPPATSTQAVKGRFAGAYYEYLGGMAGSRSASESGHTELLQVARAVGPGMSIEEFEALGKRVESLNAQRDQLTNAAYQDALWAIPEAFAAERTNPVHFRPLRDSRGKPVESELPPIPSKAVEGLAAVETPAPVPTDALASLVKPAAPQAATPQEMGAIVRGAGSGAVDAMYDGLWRKVQAGDVHEAGQKSALLQAAKMVREGGGMQSIDDLRNLAKDYGAIERGDDFQHQMRKLVEKHLSSLPSAAAAPSRDALAGMLGKPAADFQIGDTVVTHGDNGQQIAGAIKGTTDSGKFVIDTPSGAVARSRDKLEHYRPLFNAGDAVHIPRYAADSGGMGKITGKNPDGTFSVEINGRGLGSVPASDMQSPEGLEKTPREQAPVFNFAGAEDPASVGAMLSGLINQQPEENKTAAGGSSLDKAQMIADAVGVVDQTGVTDLTNAGVSLTRAFTEPDRAGEHLANAGMRAISAIPVVGDVAKLAKYGAKGAEAARSGRVAHHLASSGAEAEAKAGGKSLLRGGIDTAAQAALQLVGGGSGGGDGGNGSPPSQSPAGDAADPRKIGEDSKQAAKDISNLGESIEKFLNGMGAAGATVAAVGHAVYEKALKPVIDWFKAVDEASTKMLEHNRDLAQFNGALGSAFVQLEMARLHRDIGAAQEMAGPISRLASSQGRAEQASEDLTRPYKKLSVELQSLRTELVGAVYKAIDSIDIVGGLIDRWYGEEKNENAAKSSAEFVARQSEMRMKARKFDK